MRVYRSKFSYEDYRVNKRCFKRFMEKDDIIMKRSSRFQKLPEVIELTNNAMLLRKKRQKKTAGYSSFSEDSPVKRRCQLGDSTTEEDEE